MGSTWSYLGCRTGILDPIRRPETGSSFLYSYLHRVLRKESVRLSQRVVTGADDHVGHPAKQDGKACQRMLCILDPATCLRWWFLWRPKPKNASHVLGEGSDSAPTQTLEINPEQQKVHHKTTFTRKRTRKAILNTTRKPQQMRQENPKPQTLNRKTPQENCRTLQEEKKTVKHRKETLHPKLYTPKNHKKIPCTFQNPHCGCLSGDEHYFQ
jgi:hypothetical protein